MTLREFFKETPAEELKILAEVCRPSNIFGGVEMPEMEDWRFCDVMELKNMELIDAVFGLIGKYCHMSAEEILEEPASDFMAILKFIDMQIRKVPAYFELLESEPDSDLVAAGIEELDKFGEYNIYRSIDPNPAKWDEISEVSFNKMFTKLYMDKEHKKIEKNLNKMAESRIKNGRS